MPGPLLTNPNVSKAIDSQEQLVDTWTISMTGISEVDGLLLQANHTVKNDYLKLLPDGLSQITEIFKERKVVVVTPVLFDALGKVITTAKAIPASAALPDEG
ncbi:MAG TPA: hypothetical protein DIW44_08045 [Anaerolineaceae bacterium]|nr:hypothetical protein [Anaerolineaceae bacterium]